MELRIVDESGGTPADDLVISGIPHIQDGTYQVRSVTALPWALPMLGTYTITRRRYGATAIDGATGLPVSDAGTDTSFVASVQGADDKETSPKEGGRAGRSIMVFATVAGSHWEAMAVLHQPLES